MEEIKPTPAPARVRPLIPAHAFVFLASFCLMVIELVAGRIMAPYLGSSLYTWTSVIGIVLTGITLGNYAGGVLAERGATRRTLGLVFFLSAFAALFSFYTYEPLYAAVSVFDIPVAAASFIFAFVGFFPVSFLLSLVTPIVITLSLDSLKKTGTTVGSVYATSAFASILGTFLTGYVLIAFFGVRLIMLTVAAALMLVGFAAVSDRQLRTGTSMIVFVGLLWAGLLRAQTLCHDETAYYCIRIRDYPNYAGARALLLDKLLHSVVLDDERKLAYDYEIVYAVATEYRHRQIGRPLSALYIGGGGYVMPRYIEAAYPGADQTVVEIDPGVTAAATRYLGFDPRGPIKSVNEDGRVFLSMHAGDERYDIIFGDAFNDLSIPYHLTTREFAAHVHAHLEPGGMYALNIIDDYAHGDVLSSFVRTIGQEFAHVEVAPLTSEWRQPRRNTFVLIASDEPIDRAKWTEAARVAFQERLLPPYSIEQDQASFLIEGAEKEEYVASRRQLTLTDDYVPVDNMMIKLFNERGN